MKPAWKSTLQLTTAIIFTTGTLTNFASADAMSDLVAAAKKEGPLTTIALPHDWCNYGEMIEGFKDKYGLEVNELNPDAGSGDEIEAIKANKGNTGPQAPDVIDVGLSFGPSAKAEGLIQPYKVATWDTIPDSAKDAEGYWYGDYYGVLAFEVNTDIVKKSPQDWADLLKPDYANFGRARRRSARLQPGDPGRLCGRPGRGGRRCRQGRRGRPEVLRRAEQGGQLRAGDRQGGAARAGRDADHHPLGLQRALPTATRSRATRRSRWWCRRPASSPASTCRRSAPSRRIRTPPSCGWSTSTPTKGQLGWLKGYCHPIRFNDLVKNGKVPQDLLDKLPPAAAYEAAVFPTLDEQGAGKEVITKQWDTVVGANVQ